MGPLRSPTLKAKKTARKAIARKSGPQGPMSIDFLQTLVSLMASNDLHEVDLRDGQQRINLKRGAAPAAYAPAYAPLPMAMPAAAAPASTGAAAAPAESADAGLVPIKSPMVGTFYAAASPDAKAFVSVGSRVEEDTDVCIIEAMKVFNNIKAECRGTIAKVLAENGKPVEFGEVLFLVKP
jgi:acetyl-CoA carboxylase biotin carboxyl carrier protein